MANDLMTDIGFGMTIIGLLVIILSGIILPQSREKTFNHMIIIGSVIAVLGGIIIIARIPY